MRLPSKFLAAAAVAAAIPFYAGASAATPLTQTHGFRAADASTIEQVQYRRWDGDRRHGSRRYGYDSYYGDGYYAYGAVPGPRGYNSRWGFQPQAPSPGSSPRCTADRELNSSFPSWMCR
jgi:hypothetical protein